MLLSSSAGGIFYVDVQSPHAFSSRNWRFSSVFTLRNSWKIKIDVMGNLISKQLEITSAINLEIVKSIFAREDITIMRKKNSPAMLMLYREKHIFLWVIFFINEKHFSRRLTNSSTWILKFWILKFFFDISDEFHF